ncbi:hypothetical protein NDU88_005052 [Pleurodeles waltl]|uniref:Uncharacterized protein n=1 Tax=Pleurodeles waltl TaxID=8319 RepID=A0AAV7RKW6_PLEWA|nr:hypothetical protein NDU88_005052 [Pleurodeles waltl]
MTSNLFGLPGITRQRQTVRASGKEDEEETPAGGEERAEETGGTGAEDERRVQTLVTIEESSGRRKWMESAPEGATAPTAAQEAFRKVSSHASGEVWPNQLHMSLTCADAAGAAPEHPGVTTNERQASESSREGRRLKGSASATEGVEEDGAREDWRKEGQDGERTEDKETHRDERIWMSGERFLPN